MPAITNALRNAHNNPCIDFSRNPSSSAICRAGKSLSNAVSNCLDLILPRNAMTKRREIRFIPVSVENYLGESMYNQVCPKTKVSTDQVLNARVKTVFDKLVQECPRKNMKWEVRVLDHKMVNAFCLPGGKVTITTGIIERLNQKYEFDKDGKYGQLTVDDHLAAVLGHEIVHAAAGHGARKLQLMLLLSALGATMAFVLPFFLVKKKSKRDNDDSVAAQRVLTGIGIYVVFNHLKNLFAVRHGQSHEFESDKYGIKLAHQAGYNVNASVRLQAVFLALKGKKEGYQSTPAEKWNEFWATHPPSQARLERNKATIAKIETVGLAAAFE